VTLPSFGGSAAGVVELAVAAEAAGVDRVVVPDHVVMGAGVGAYPWGALPGGPDDPWLEPLTVLAAVAGATARVRLATSVVIAPLRPAVLLAKTAATVDVLSGGRLDLGVGTGWQRAEYDAAGVPWAGRGDRLDDTLRACRALWRDAPASFASPTVSFRDVHCSPRPQGLRLWIAGAMTPRTLRRLRELDAGWIPLPGATPEDVAAGVRAFAAAAPRNAAAARGRAAAPRDRAAPPDAAAPPRQVATTPRDHAARDAAAPPPRPLPVQATIGDLADAPAYLAAGATTIRVAMPPIAQLADTVARFAAIADAR
jgi:probable F420-dependent oxidoreductase